MDEPTSTDGSPTIDWRTLPPGEVPLPLVRRLPYLELKLEHPTLDASGAADRFFPDAVPYKLDGTPRVFYWRPSLTFSSGAPSDWEVACATTHGLLGADVLPADLPPLVGEGADGTVLVVEGTVAGETTTARVASYSPSKVSVVDSSGAAIGLQVDGTAHSVPAGERRRIRLPEQRVEPVDGEGGPVTVTPELAIRFPGRRELHHPAPEASSRLFPSFGLALDEVPNPLPVPMRAGELDDAALATALGVDLSGRPYPERVLWQAFAYTAFDPHADATSALAQLETGHIVVRTRQADDT